MKKIIAIILLFSGANAHAFLKYAGFSADVDILGGAGLQMNPPTEYSQQMPPSYQKKKFPFYDHHNSYTGESVYAQWGGEVQADLRLLASWTSDRFELKWNQLCHAHGYYQTLPLFSFTEDPPHRSFNLQVGRGNNRNPYEDRSKSQGELYQLTDQLYFKWSPVQKLEIRIGRQPINLATNHYFTPNDLFSPFSPDDFLRNYKNGEDAIRITASPDPLAQFEVIALAGYERTYNWNYDHDNATFEKEQFAPEFYKRKAGLLGHSHFSMGPLAIGTVFGWDANRDLCGVSVEKDLGSGWLFGLEGNGSRYDDTPGHSWLDASFGLSKQLNAATTARIEFASSPSFPVSPYFNAVEREQRSLNAIGVDWQSSGLWQGGIVNLSDLDRWEGLLSWNARRSLSDEVDLILGGGIPWRLQKERPETATIFELAPLSLNLQIRWVI